MHCLSANTIFKHKVCHRKLLISLRFVFGLIVALYKAVAALQCDTVYQIHAIR